MASIASEATLFAALGEETRLRIVTRLCDHGPTSIAGLSAGSGVSRQAITKHLRVMEKAGLVHGRQQGREMVWKLDAPRLDDARQYLHRIARQWDSAVDRLRLLVEDG